MRRILSGGVLLVAAGSAAAQTGTLGVTTCADQDAFGTGPTLGSGFTATVQLAGIRPATGGTRFFNVQGSAAGAFASWGGIDFDLTEVYAELDSLAVLGGFGPGDWTITAATLELTQSNSGFTLDGGVDILWTDDAVDFDPRTGSPTRYTFPAIPFSTTHVLSYTFVEVVTGHVDQHNIGTPAVLADLNDQGDLHLALILNPTDPTVAATYKGQDSPFNGQSAPCLVMGYKLGPSCYPDCDTSTGVGVLDIFDFLCFQNEYAAGSPYACECDTSTGPGVCDIFDFLCFQNEFAAGCP